MGKLKFIEDDFRYLQKYDPNTLANMVGYEDYHAIGKGMLTGKDKDYILLLVTKIKRTHVTQYIDQLDDYKLHIQGQEKHGTDQRINSNMHTNHDKFYLFYREKYDLPFTYHGRVFLTRSDLNNSEPSRFEFVLSMQEEIEDDSAITDYAIMREGKESIDHTILEGTRLITRHVRYERNPKNRTEAIKIHGRACKICGFNFDTIYGKPLAEGYIEIHHIQPLSEGEQVVDPLTDLIPVCANCHRMLHRKKKENIGIEALKKEKRLDAYRKMLGGFNGR